MTSSFHSRFHGAVLIHLSFNKYECFSPPTLSQCPLRNGCLLPFRNPPERIPHSNRVLKSKSFRNKNLISCISNSSFQKLATLPPFHHSKSPRAVKYALKVGNIQNQRVFFSKKSFSWFDLIFNNDKRNISRPALEESSSSIDVELEIFEFMQNSEDPGSFPTRQQLINAGREDLVNAIVEEGGWLTIGWDDAEKNEYSETNSNLTKSSIDVAGMLSPHSYSNLRSKESSIMGEERGMRSGVGESENEEHGWKDFKNKDNQQLSDDFSFDDPLPPDAPKSNMKKRRKPRGYWKNDDNLKKEIEQYLSDHSGLSSKGLRESGHQDLENAIQRRGGWKVVADLFHIASTTFKGVSRSAKAVRRRDRGSFQEASSSLSSGKTGSQAEEAPVIDQWQRLKSNELQPNRAIDFAKSKNVLPSWEERNRKDESVADNEHPTLRRRMQRRRKKKEGEGEDSSPAVDPSETSDSISENDKNESSSTQSVLRSANFRPPSIKPQVDSGSAEPAQKDKTKMQEEDMGENRITTKDEILSPDRDRVLSKKLPDDARMMLERIRALESSLSATREALQSGRNSLIDEGKKLRESTIAELAKVTDSLEFRESEIMKTRMELRNTKAKVSALEGRLATEFSEATRELSEKQGRIEEIESIILQMRTVKVVFPNPGNEVLLAGSFDGWNNRIKMIKSNAGVFVATLQLYPGKYEIKFIVDGIWRVDPGRQIAYTNDGSENNVLFVV